MLRIVIALTLVALTLAGTVPDATQSEEFLAWSGRIVGGATATPGQFPYQASLRTLQNGHFCGGFIINNRWVGSAAHCTVNRHGGNMIVVAGAHHRINGGTTHAVNLVINHESYSSVTLVNDISIVRTTGPITFTASVRAIDLGSTFIGGGGAIGSGWGQTAHPGSAAVELQFATVTVISNEDCRGRLTGTNALRIFESTICTTSPVNIGMCMGDSGGPLVQNNQVIGAVSWGIACARGSPDMFARISSFRDWINGRISANP